MANDSSNISKSFVITRQFWVLVHRYAGLFIAFFLIIIGLTGSIIVFNEELYKWFDPPPSVTPQNTPMLDAFTLRDKAEALEPHGRVNSLSFNYKPNEVYLAYLEPRIDPATNKPYGLKYDLVMLDPYTGEVLRQEKGSSDIWPITNKNIMILINRLHYQMALPGSFGSYLFGIVALVWTIDCFVSAYLTFPMNVRRRESKSVTPQAPRKSWLARWWNPAWLVKWNGSAYRINFDLHRACGLWVWIMLLAIAWSSVGFNLGEQVYMPVMKAVFNMPDTLGDLPKLKKPQIEPNLRWKEAYTIGKQLMAEQATNRRFKVQRELALMYFSEQGVFIYNVRTDRDLNYNQSNGATNLFFDGTSGKFLGLDLPRGQNAGATLHNWIFALHMAMIWGLPFRVFVTFVGILIAMLSITGVYIWLKKRKARQFSQEKRAKLDAEVVV